jgi:hypothetical protein
MKTMRFRIAVATSFVLLFVGLDGLSNNNLYDVFIPISKYIRKGDAEKLSAWFSDNLEVSIMSRTSDSSKGQAKQILKSFFKEYNPRTFDITHTAGRNNMKYAIGSLSAGGELFEVTIFINYKKQSYKIQQLKIDKMKH